VVESYEYAATSHLFRSFPRKRESGKLGPRFRGDERMVHRCHATATHSKHATFRIVPMKWPRIRSRRTTAVSPWVSIIAREVEFSRGAAPQTYHAVEQADYISIVALTPSGKIPIVRQYRPALEAFAWELPAGLVDPGEDPADGCRRELMEETGFTARTVHALGENSACTGRLNNRIHNFFVEAGERTRAFEPEPGISVKLVSPAEIARLIKRGVFLSQLHIGALLLAELHGFLALPRNTPRRPRRLRRARKLTGRA
jgi:ADP-ribose pyrophosphatase